MESFGQAFPLQESAQIENSSGQIINPGTEETLQQIANKKIGDSFWLKNVIGAIKKFSFDASSQLRVVIGSIGSITTLTTLTTMTTGNIGIGDSGKTATMLSTSHTNFQQGARRLIRKI